MGCPARTYITHIDSYGMIYDKRPIYHANLKDPIPADARYAAVWIRSAICPPQQSSLINVISLSSELSPQLP